MIYLVCDKTTDQNGLQLYANMSGPKVLKNTLLAPEIVCKVWIKYTSIQQDIMGPFFGQQ